MSATRKDVQQDNETETETGVEATENPRQDHLEQIAEENHRLMLEELEAKADDVDQPVETKSEPHSLSEDDLANMRVKTKVDGVEEEHSIADLVKSYQKDSAASRRLEDATRRQREIEAREADLEARESALNTPKDDALPHDRDALISEAFDALLEGEEGKTKEIFRKLLTERQEATPKNDSVDVDPAEIANQVKTQIRFDDAMTRFSKDHANIVEDPHLVKVADAYLAEELADGVEIAEAMKNAGERTQEWLRQKSGTKAPEKDEKLERKRALDEPRVASMRDSRAETVNETTPQEASSIIAEMRKARGLPV